MARKLPPNFAIPVDLPVVPGCDHDCEPIHDPRTPFTFEAWSCKKCGTKFYIPKYEAV